MLQALFEGTFNPAYHFLGLVQKAMSDGITRRCVHAGSAIYLVPSENTYYSEHSDIRELESLCLAAPFDFSVELLPEWRPEKEQIVQAGRMLIKQKGPMADTGLLPHSLNELLWYAALCGSGGLLLLDARADVPVRLLACPDFSRYFHREHDPVLAEYMLDKSLPLTAVSEATGIPLSQVFSFYNACSVLGLIVVEPDRNVLDPAEYLLGLLEKAEADRQIRRCVLAGQAPLFLVPEEGKYYSEANFEGIAKLCATPLSEQTVEIVNRDSDGEEEIVQVGRTKIRRKKEPLLPKIPGHPLSDLLFHAALYASQGRLLPGYNLNTPVRLKAWPDKALLKEAASVKDERYFFALIAYMVTNTVSLTDIAKATNLPLEKVIDFHNACAVAGLLEHP